MNVNILIVGVGGQGTVLASRILGAVASLLGKECKLSEVHGMSQRGGSVVTHVRIADNVSSPIIAQGEADIILAFELLESARWRHFASENGLIIVNTQRIWPMPVIGGAVDYPENLVEMMQKEGKRVIALDAYALACRAGTDKAINTVMIGTMAKHLGWDKEIVQQAIERSVKPMFIDVNKRAFELGYNANDANKYQLQGENCIKFRQEKIQ